MAILVGTSGFDYKDWRGPFYPRFIKPGDRLAFYAEHFATVELNVTFYRMPAASAFRGWRDAVPDGFVFAVKASRYLTHIKRLADPQGSVEYLMERASILGDRLGPILLQLPPSLEIDLERLDRTLEAFGDRVRVAVEPRHKSWFVPELCDVLRAHDAAFVLADRRCDPSRRSGRRRLVLPADAPGECHATPCYGGPGAAVVARAAGGAAGSTARRVRLLQQRPQGVCSGECAVVRGAPRRRLTAHAGELCPRY